MDKNLSALKPALVWKHFAQIARIPRPSSHEEKIRKYVMDFAKSRGLECKEDAAHNVYVRKPASTAGRVRMIRRTSFSFNARTASAMAV